MTTARILLTEVGWLIRKLTARYASQQNIIQVMTRVTLAHNLWWPATRESGLQSRQYGSRASAEVCARVEAVRSSHAAAAHSSDSHKDGKP